MIVSGFRRSGRAGILLALVAVAWFGAVEPGRAATITARTDAELAAMSARIVRARVLAVWSESARQDGLADGGIYTIARLAVLEDFTGGREPVLEVQELGGVIGARAMVVPGTPVFTPGQEVVLFLEPGRGGRWRTVSMAYGAFTVQGSGADARLIREIAGVELVPSAAQMAQSAAARAAEVGTGRLLARLRDTIAAVKGVAPVEPEGAAALQPDRAAAAAGQVSAPFQLLGDMRWMQADAGTAVQWFREPSNQAPVQAGVSVESVIGRAMAAWTNPTQASLILSYAGTRNATITSPGDYCGPATQNVGLIVFENPANDSDLASGVLAIGGGCQNFGSTKVVNGHTFSAISHAFVIFNNKSRISTSLQSDVNFSRILTHEIGHAIGLDHTSTAANLMLPSCCTSDMPIPPAIGTDDLAGVTFIYPAIEVPTDDDHDGLLDDWERQFGLNPADPNGPNGPTGDPDGDGIDNAHEQTNGTHPRGFVTRYFAEGAVNAFFDTQFALVNPGTADAHVLLRLQPQQDGVASAEPERTLVLRVAGQSRATVTADMLRMRLSSAFATIIESDVPVVADRTMTWGGGYGSHAETAVIAPSTTWYFAEGATGPLFNLYYLLQNPHDVPVTAHIRYLRGGSAPPLDKDYVLPKKSRTTIDVRGERFAGDPVNQPGPLSIAEVSGIVTVPTPPGGPDRPIIAERALYRFVAGQTFGAGHEGAGVPAPSQNWFLAEGATGFFDQFILIANPNVQPVEVDVTYLLEGGGTRAKKYRVGPESRFTIQVSEETIDGFSFRSAAFSTRLSAPLPIIVERAMWWRSGTSDWVEGHNAAGATESGPRWALADGETGGPRNIQTYILVANVGTQASGIRVTYYRESTCGDGSEPCPPIVWETDGTTEERKIVPANARKTIDPASLPELRGKRFSAVIESLNSQPLIVERSMYSDAGGIFWAAGTAALGTKLP